MARRIRHLVAVLALTTAGLIASAGPAFACSTYGRTYDDVVATSRLIVEADVTARHPGGGFRLAVREVFKGSMSASGIVGAESVPESGCSGRVALEVGDHVVLGFMDPATALGAATVVWWVEPDGTIERTSIVEDTATTTIEKVRAALRSRLPDTATPSRDEALPPGASGAWPPGLLALILAITFTIQMRPRARRSGTAPPRPAFGRASTG